MSKIVDEVLNLIAPYADECGVEIVDIEYAKKNNGNNLTIYIDKVGGVNIDDCVKLHKLIDEPLDELDPTKGVSYILNVSSCGVDRPFKNLKDYERNIGKEIELIFYKPYNGKKNYKGILISANSEIVEIELDNKEIQKIEKELIASANVVFNMEVKNAK